MLCYDTVIKFTNFTFKVFLTKQEETEKLQSAKPYAPTVFSHILINQHVKICLTKFTQ